MTFKKVPRIFLTRGLQGSGKSTWANQMSYKYDNVIKISLDDLRYTLFVNYNFEKDTENFVKLSQFALIETALAAGKDVIVHNTHLDPSAVNRIRKHFLRKAEIYIVDFTDIAEEIIDQRNFDRLYTSDFVPKDVVQRFKKLWNRTKTSAQWDKYDIISPWEADGILSVKQELRTIETYLPDESLPDTVIIDIDGTLANISHRNPFDHTKYHLDTPNHAISKLSNSFSKTVILTGRDEEYREVTQNWLEDHGIYYELLLMRANDDKRPDYVVKKEIFFEKIAPHYNVQLVIEDRKQVVEMWREIGLLCAQVDEGDF